MKYPTRIYYTEADKSLIWDRWQKGESLNSIGQKQLLVLTCQNFR